MCQNLYKRKIPIESVEMHPNQPHATFGTRGDILECDINAMPARASIELRFPVVLTISSPDRTRDNPIRVYLPADHAVRLIKELASSVLADT